MDLPKSTVARAEQLLNTLFPTTVTKSGRVTDVRDLQKLNELSPIETSDFPKFTVVREMQPVNALFSMTVTESGRFRDVREVQP